MNEELVITNEELQTTHEELRAVNEELETMNSEHQNKVQELMQLHDDIENLLYSANMSMIFFGKALQVRQYTSTITSTISLTSQDIGRPIDHLALPFTDIGNALRQDMDDVMVQQRVVEKEVISGEGHWFVLRLSPYMSEERRCEGVVLSLIDITRLKTAEERLQEERSSYRQNAHETGELSPINPQCQPHQSTPTAGAPGACLSESAHPGELAQNYPSVSSQ